MILSLETSSRPPRPNEYPEIFRTWREWTEIRASSPRPGAAGMASWRNRRATLPLEWTWAPCPAPDWSRTRWASPGSGGADGSGEERLEEGAAEVEATPLTGMAWTWDSPCKRNVPGWAAVDLRWGSRCWMQWCFPPDAASSWTAYWKLHSYDLVCTVGEVLKCVGAAVRPALLGWWAHCFSVIRCAGLLFLRTTLSDATNPLHPCFASLLYEKVPRSKEARQQSFGNPLLKMVKLLAEHLRWAWSSSLELMKRPFSFGAAVFHFDLIEVTPNRSSQHQPLSCEVWVWITLLQFKRLHLAPWSRPPRLCAPHWSNLSVCAELSWRACHLLN